LKNVVESDIIRDSNVKAVIAGFNSDDSATLCIRVSQYKHYATVYLTPFESLFFTCWRKFVVSAVRSGCI